MHIHSRRPGRGDGAGGARLHDLNEEIFMTLRTRAWAALIASAAVCATPALAQTQGVSKNEIVLGTIQDLSGPIAAFGKTSRNGMLLRVDEINEQGGIHGRRVRLIVEDSGYDPKKAVLATQKLAQSDRIFAAVGTLGTAPSMAAMPILFDKNIAHLFPITAARQMYEPLHRLKYSFAATYYDQVRSLAKYMTRIKADRKWCVLYQDDDFGSEVLGGLEQGLKENGGQKIVEKTSYKRGATDFSSQIQKMKGAGCDTVVLGTIIRETVGALSEAKKLGWSPQFVGTSASYTHLIHQIGGPVTNGLISAMTVQHPYLDEASQPLRFWANKYKTRFNEDPDVFAVYGYLIMDVTAKALDNAGANLTMDAFVKALDSLSYENPMFGGDRMSFTPTRHLGTNKARFSQIKDGRWVVISDFVEP
jgi:branched-chain amino acid transport system substrate-binding protein